MVKLYVSEGAMEVSGVTKYLRKNLVKTKKIDRQNFFLQFQK